MNIEYKRRLAQHMLAQKTNGYSLSYIFRRSAWRCLLHFLAGILMLLLCLGTNDLAWRLFAMCGFGMICGAIARDLGWLRTLKRNWPFTLEVTDWKKVNDIAQAEESANKAMEA